MTESKPAESGQPHDGLVPAERAVDLLALVESGIAESQRSRRPSDDMVRAFADRGLLQILAPAAYGGEEADGLAFLELVETIAVVDGSAAWTVMTLNEEMEIACAYLPAEHMASVIGAPDAVVVAGAGAPQGTAVRQDGGWVLDGHWRLITGGLAADFIVLGTLVEGPRPRSFCYALVPGGEADVLDTWDTVGMRGTGSNDVALHNVFVPDERVGITADLTDTVVDGPLFRLPPSLRFPFPKVGVAAGVARGALAEFVELAGTKRGRLGSAFLREQPDAQLAVAEAEALIGTGRAFAVEQLEALWVLAADGAPIPPEVHARVRLACSTAVANCVRAVETIATAAGTSANAVDDPLVRRLADVRAVAQHFMVGGYHRLSAGQVLLGLSPHDPLF